MSSDDQYFVDPDEVSDVDDEELKRIQVLKNEVVSAGNERVDGGNNNVPGDLASLHIGSADHDLGISESSTRAPVTEALRQPTPAENMTEGFTTTSAALDAVHPATPTLQTFTSREQSDEITRPSGTDDDLQLGPQSEIPPQTSASDTVKLENAAAIDGAQGESQIRNQASTNVNKDPVAANSDGSPDKELTRAPDTGDQNEGPIDISIGHQFASGREQQANSHDAGYQSAPAIAALDDGGYVVTWASSGQDGSGHGIFGQRYDGSGNPVGEEFQTNSYTASHQNAPTVTALSDGGYVVSWTSYGQDGSSYGIFGQRFDADGNPAGGEFQANATSQGYQYSPSITGLEDGGFVVSWSSYSVNGSTYDVYAQRFDAEGELAGGEFLINSQTEGYQFTPAITSLAGGGFIATWSSYNPSDRSYDVHGQRFDAEGEAVGDEMLINSQAEGYQFGPSVVGLEGGGFVTTWSSYNQGASSYDVHGQRFDADGNAIGEEFLINTHTDSLQYDPSITSFADGGFMVTWSSYGQDGSGYGVYAQRFDGEGQAVGDEFQVNDHSAGNQYTPAVTALQDGSVVVTWASNDAGDMDVMQKVYRQGVVENAADGTVVATVTASDPNGDRLTYSLADDADGRFAIDAETGVITVADGSKLDYENASSHNVVVRVTDSHGLSTDKAINIDLADQNEAPIELNLRAEAVVENVTNGTVVGSAAATDQDANETFTYSLADDADGRFAIDAQTGEITVADTSKIDYESETSHSVTVQVTDSVGNTRTEQVSFEITNAVGDDIAGTDSDDRLYGTSEEDSLYGGTGNDTITAGDGADLLEGGDGNDYLRGDAGDDTLRGGAGSDRLLGGDGNDTVIGGTGNDYLYGQAGNDLLDGGEGNDVLLGDEGEDVIDAGAGNDSVYGGAGADTLDGGEGLDYLRYDQSAAGVQVDLGAGTASGGDAEGDRFGNFERLVGSAHDDTLTGDDGANYVYGRAGDDRIDGGAGNDNLRGEDGNDTVIGGTGNDYLYGQAGDDMLDGGEGDDRLYGGDGDDMLQGGAGNDYLDGGAGNDLFILMQAQGNDRISGGSGGAWTDVIELQDGGGAIGELGSDWTVSIESGEIKSSGSDGDSSWLELTDDASGTITMQDGTEFIFDGIEHIYW